MSLQNLKSLGCQDTLDHFHVAMTMVVIFLAWNFKQYYLILVLRMCQQLVAILLQMAFVNACIS